MNEAVAVGIVGILIGLVVCLRGYVALRVIIALLGAWVGFILGATVVASITGDGLFGSLAGFAGGVVGALVLALLAYAFYQVAVLLGLGSLAYTITLGVLVAAGVQNSTLLWLVPLVVAVLLVVVGIAVDLPAGILVVLTALAGANITITGLLVLLGDISTGAIDDGGASETLPVWWAIAALALAIVGAVVQFRGVARSRRMREAWAG